MKIKLNHHQIALSALLLLSTSFTNAAPTVTTSDFEAFWQWQFPQAQMPGPFKTCESFSICQTTPFAPALVE